MNNKSNLTSLLESTLLDKGIVSKEQCDFVKSLQNSESLTFDAALIKSEILDKGELASIFENLFEIRSVKIEELDIDIEAIKHIPAHLAYKYSLIPFRRSGNSLAVAFADIANTRAYKALKEATDFEIVPFEARLDAIEHAQFVYYGDPSVLNAYADSDEQIKMFHQRSHFIEETEKFEGIGKSLSINKKFTFESFVASNENQFAFGLCKSIFDSNQENGSNPLLIWGDVGSGKTHLLHGIANHIALNLPMQKFIFTNASVFIESLYDSFMSDKVNLFEFLYCETDYLIIDDCDRFVGYDKAQQELAQIINTLRKVNKPVILASRLPLNHLSSINIKLKEEIDSGIMAQIMSYTDETCLNVLCSYSKSLSSSQDTLKHLIKLYQGNMGALVDLTKQLSVLAKENKTEISKEMIDRVINTVQSSSQN